MKNLSKTILASLATCLITCAVFSQQAQAVTVQGVITFGGTATFDHKLATATEVTAWGPVSVVAGTGDFATTTGSVTMSPTWTFNPGGSQTALWSVNGFTFDLTMSTILHQDSTTLSISGTGFISGNGFTTTAGTWNFTAQPPNLGGNTFSFSAGTATVPDGGSAVALLGIALTGIEVLRRKLKAAKAA